MNILVTGGAGFVGSNLVEELIKENDVYVLDNLHSGSLKNLEDTKDVVKIFIDSSTNISKLNLPEIDIIYHLGIPSSSPMYKQNPYLVNDAVNGAINIFEYAKNNNVKKVVYASSSSLYNGIKPPHREDADIKVTDYYTEARLYVERIAKLYNLLHGIRSVGLRFFSVYGPHEEAKGKYANIISQFLWDMRKDESPIIYGDGRQTRDFTYVKDIVNALLLFKDKEFEYDIFNAGTGTSYSFNDVIDILNNKLNKNIEATYIKMPMNNYVDETLADITKIKKIGYEPKYDLDKGIDRII